MLRPRVKSVFPPMPVDAHTIAIGGADHGLAAELSDDSGHLWTLLGLLDGSRDLDAVVAEMRRRDPALTPEDVAAVVADLTEAGYVEDAAAPLPPALTGAEVARYRRNAEFFSFFARHPQTGYDYQARLQASRVTVLGVGGLGSYVALALAAAGVGDLLLVDDDVVEEHNLNRQVLYTEADLGRSKVEAARQRVHEVNPHVRVEAVSRRVSGVEDARACFEGRDLLVCAADRPRIRIYEWLNAASIAEGVAWVRGANDGLTINSFLHVPGVTACFECEQRHALATFPWYAGRLAFARDVLGDQTVNPCTAPVAGLIGSLTALEVVKYLSGAADPVTRGRKLTLDLQTLETRLTDGERDLACPACSHLHAGAA